MQIVICKFPPPMSEGPSPMGPSLKRLGLGLTREID